MAITGIRGAAGGRHPAVAKPYCRHTYVQYPSASERAPLSLTINTIDTMDTFDTIDAIMDTMSPDRIGTTFA